MKIIMIQGGLGNQLFEYVYYKYLCKKYPNEKIWGFYYKKWLKDHNGLEISKWFDVALPPSNGLVYYFALLLYYINGVCIRLGFTPFFINKNWAQDDEAFFQIGFWQDVKYQKEIELPSLKQLNLDDYNKILLTMIQNCESVSVHIRRGDYLTSKNKEIFGNICTTEYYKNAIVAAKKYFNNPTFFVFSNDIEYVEELFSQENDMIIVDNNQGPKSFYDMYLMSQCKGMILANSTFSCWAAYLNKTSPYIFCPKRWTNEVNHPNMSFDNWIIIR